ncbi:unnamed protein product [Ascophyllum nodosum]
MVYSSDMTYTVLGVIGCSLVAFAQIPNIVRVHKRKQSLDISYTYQFVLATGVLLFVAYYIYYSSVLAYPAAVSLVFILYLTGLKYYMESPCQPRTSSVKGPAGLHLEHALLPEGVERSDGREHSDENDP